MPLQLVLLTRHVLDDVLSLDYHSSLDISALWDLVSGIKISFIVEYRMLLVHAFNPGLCSSLIGDPESLETQDSE